MPVPLPQAQQTLVAVAAHQQEVVAFDTLSGSLVWRQPQTKTLFASVTATSNLGVDSDWFSYTFIDGCCTGVIASAGISGGGCQVESTAYIQISNGCSALRTITRNEECPEVFKED